MTGMGDSMDLELAAASLRADGSDVRLLVKVLADTLADALGTRLDVKRSGGRFRKSDDIRSIRITMDDDQFDAEGGIRIRSEKVEVDAWLGRLLAVLKAEAAHSQSVRRALEAIVIGGDQ
jgi:hypothetical protein